MKVYFLTGFVLLFSIENAQTENSKTDETGTLNQTMCFQMKSIFTGNPGNHIIKWDPLALNRGHLTFGYERPIHDNRSINFQIGFVVPSLHGYNSVKTDNTLSNAWHAKGVFIRSGFRFYQSSTWNASCEFADAAFYIEPEITLGKIKEELVYGYNNTEFITTGNGTLRLTHRRLHKNINMMALTFNTGAQFKFMDRWVAECFFGIGVGLSSKMGDKDYDDKGGFSSADNHAFIGPFYQMPFVFSGGFKLGMMIY